MIFTFLATELIKEAKSRSELSKQVRDACTEAGQGVYRSAVNFVIGGLLFANALKESATAENLALGWTRNVESLCGGARMEFSPQELMELRKMGERRLLERLLERCCVTFPVHPHGRLMFSPQVPCGTRETANASNELNSGQPRSFMPRCRSQLKSRPWRY